MYVTKLLALRYNSRWPSADYFLEVRTFLETHKIGKNLPHGFDKSTDLLSQNHEEDFFTLCVLLKKSKLYQVPMYLQFGPILQKTLQALFKAN